MFDFQELEKLNMFEETEQENGRRQKYSAAKKCERKLGIQTEAVQPGGHDWHTRGCGQRFRRSETIDYNNKWNTKV